jgi:hypothetical protein
MDPQHSWVGRWTHTCERRAQPPLLPWTATPRARVPLSLLRSHSPRLLLRVVVAAACAVLHPLHLQPRVPRAATR